MANKGDVQELLVAGYVREMEKIYDITNIPVDIIDIIYLYQQVCDKWSKKYSHHDIIIDDIDNTITFDADHTATAFGTRLVDTGVYKWMIKRLTKESTYYKTYPYIGIIKDNQENLDKYIDSSSWEYVGYQYCAGSGYICGINRMPFEFNFEWNEYKLNDKLEIILDLNQQTLAFSLNGKDAVVAFENIEKAKYRLVLSSYNDHEAQFQLL